MNHCKATVGLIFFFGLCCVRSTVAHADASGSLAGRLGFEGCRLSKPLTKAQVMELDMSGGNEAARAHPDWDELIAKYVAGDQIYFIDCRKADSTRLFAGTSLYVLVRQNVVIARVSDTTHE